MSAAGSRGRNTLLAVLGATYLLDTLVLNQGFVALLVAAGAVVATVVARVRGRSSTAAAVVQLALALALVPAVLATNGWLNRVARRRAEAVIAACEAYEREHGRYPRDLTELVPAHLSEVPRAKPTLLFGSFRYSPGCLPGEPCDGRQPFLLYVAIPPFGRPTYRFTDGAWGYVD